MDQKNVRDGCSQPSAFFILLPVPGGAAKSRIPNPGPISSLSTLNSPHFLKGVFPHLSRRAAALGGHAGHIAGEGVQQVELLPGPEGLLG